jgi:RNA 2',3'-cyclic 3'-phosphodiesterase
MGKRLFIAADISEEARAAASGLIAPLQLQFPVKGVSWSKPENLHVTIKFLGETDETTEGILIEKLSSIAASYQPFRLQLDKPEVLGKRVFSIVIRSDSPTVFSLEMVIDTECERLGFPREGRRFHPHLTLARIRKPENARQLGKHFLQMQIEPLSFDVREIVLYESELSSGGSIYRKVKSFALATEK